MPLSSIGSPENVEAPSFIHSRKVNYDLRVGVAELSTRGRRNLRHVAKSIDLKHSVNKLEDDPEYT